MNDIALQPCPICGSRELTMLDIKRKGFGKSYYVACITKGDHRLSTNYYPDEEAALEAWNRIKAEK